MGIVLFMSLCFDYPFVKKATLEDGLYRYLAKGDYETFWSIKSVHCLSEEVRDLIQGMLAADPEKRLTLEQVKMHPWLQLPLPESEKVLQGMKRRQRKFDEDILEEYRRQKKDKEQGSAKK